VTRAGASPRVPARRRVPAGAAWLLAGVAALSACATRAGAETLSLGVSDGPVSLPIYVADARGFFSDEGLDVRLRACRSGSECYQWLEDGSVDLATAAELLVAAGGATRKGVAIIATISASSYQIKLVARHSAQVMEAPQLRGKRIGTVPGSSAQYFLDNWLVFNDIDPQSVSIVGLAPDSLIPALESHTVDAIAIWEPIASLAAAALGGDAVTFVSPRVYTQHFNLVATRATLGRRDADVLGLLRALIRAHDAIAEAPDAARALLAERLHVAPAIAASIMAGQDYRIRLDQSLVTTLQGQARWLARRGLARPAGAGLAGVIDPAPLRRVAPGAVGLVQ
jgi:ABC-type nitrate/sulfonate/bicarbonate transport system substrate-binding protein